ncbi:MAG: hypothetical protein AAGF01_12645 [Cyanobacteria bacterium P01_G01_bin.38]
MTNGPIEQPMSNDELRALVANNARTIAELRESTTELRESTASTNRSVQELRGELAAGFEETKKITESNARAIAALSDARTEAAEIDERRTAEHLDRMDRSEQQIRLLSELVGTAYQREQLRDGRIDRLESEREPSLREMLQRVLDRLEQIWQRLSA